nr:hypothetical protein [Tanacetum cinerariifolium]
MRTRSSSNLIGESSSNLTTSNPKRCNRRRSKQPFSLEESPLDMMSDQRTMTKLLRAPTEGYVEAIVVPPILAEHFELKNSLINMMTSDQFFRLEKDNPHDHIHLVSKFINEFFPPSRTTNLRNEISNFQQYFDESFHEAWDHYKDLLRACPNHGFTNLNQLDTFYNTLNLFDQDSLNSAAGGNLLERRTQDVLTIIENKSNVRNSRNKSIVSQVKSSDVNSSSSSKIAKITHAVNQQTNACLTADGKTFLKFQDNIQGDVSAAAVNYNQDSGPLPSNTIAKPKGELKAITTQSGLVLDGPSVPMPPLFINPEEDERVDEALTNQELAENTIKVPPLFVQKAKPLSLRNYVDKLLELENTPLNSNCLVVIVKKLPEKLRDPGKFLILCGFSELKCKALADVGASINLMPLSVWKKLVPLILGRPFLRIARALIDVHGEEMIFRDGDERLTLNMRHDTSSYSNQPHKESIIMINIYNDSYEDCLEDLFATNHLSGNPTFSSPTDLTSPKVINPLSGNTTSSSPDHLLEEFADKLALITFPPGNDDLPFDIESDVREIEYFLNHDPTKEMDSILEDSVDECHLADLNNDLVETIPEMFTYEHSLDYSSPPLYDDDLVELESDNDDVYNDPFDSKEDKIKESNLLIDELDPPRSSDFLPFSEYDSVLYEDFFKVDLLPLTNNEDKVFNPGVLIYENLFEVTE